MRHIDGLQGFGQRTDLVHFHQHGVCNALSDTIGQTGRVGHKEVVANQLNLVAELFSQQFPASPVVFCHAVFDRDDRVVSAESGEVVSVFFRGQRFAFALHLVFAIDEVFGRCAVESEVDVFASFVARFFNRGQDEVESLTGRFQCRCETTFVADTSVVTSSREFFFQGVEHLRTHADRFFHVRCRNWHDHEFLDVDWVVCVLTAVDDVHHWNRQNACRGAANVTEQRLASVFCRSFRNCERYAEDRVCAQTTFVRGAVEFDHRFVDLNLFQNVVADECLSDFAVDCSNRFENAFAHVTGFVAVTLFYGFMCAGRCARRNRSAAHGAIFEDDVDFDSRVAAAIKDFAGVDVDDCAHEDRSCAEMSLFSSAL